jgi:hypothetical protein
VAGEERLRQRLAVERRDADAVRYAAGFLPSPPATSRERSSAQAEAYRGMPNFFVFGLGFFGAMAAGES